MTDLTKLTLAAARQGLAAKDFSAIELTDAYLGAIEAGGRRYAEYAYSIPESTSHYRVQTGRDPHDEKVVPYQGRFLIDRENLELKSLTVRMNPPPDEIKACGVETRIVYRRVAIGSARFLLPEQTLLIENSTTGARSENRVEYDACHEFRSESVFLASEDAGFITGSTITANGAQYLT